MTTKYSLAEAAHCPDVRVRSMDCSMYDHIMLLRDISRHTGHKSKQSIIVSVPQSGRRATLTDLRNLLDLFDLTVLEWKQPVVEAEAFCIGWLDLRSIIDNALKLLHDFGDLTLIVAIAGIDGIHKRSG